MNRRPEILVVEGQHDASRIKQVYPDVDIIVTNGSEISANTIELLQTAQKTRGLILMTDPDFPGEKIRKTIEEYVGPTKHVFIEKSVCIDNRKKKVGIEHAPLHTIENALKNHVLTPDEDCKIWTMNDLVSMGLSSGEQARVLRNAITKRLHLGMCNSKTLLKRLNMFGIPKEVVLELIP